MASNKRKTPDFFEETPFDPVRTATGYPAQARGRGFKPSGGSSGRQVQPAASESPVKRKAGFYISEELLQRFNLKYHELKLADVPVDNKSGLLEILLTFALDDLDKGSGGKILPQLTR
jgi:hypothetical protein